MESFNFELKLISDIDRVAGKGATALKGVEKQSSKTQKALDWGSTLGKQLEKVGFTSARAAKKQEQAFAQAWAKIGMAAERAAKQQQRAFERAVERRMERMQDRSMLGGIKEGLGVGKLTSAAFYGSALAEGMFKVVDIIAEGARKFVETVEDGVKRAYEEAGKQQTLRLGERISLGGAGGKEFREDVGRFSKLTGFDDDAIRQMILPMRRAGFGQQGARSAFAAAADVAAGEGRGGDQGRVNELLEGFTNIMLKGGVRDKQLVGLGVAVKPFFADLAKQLHVSAATAQKRASEGKVDPQLLLNTIYKGIERRQGGKLGTGAVEYSKTFEAHLEKVKNLPNEYLKNLVDSPAFERANEVLGRLLENLDPDSPTGQRIMSAVEHMFERITGFVGDPRDAADSLADKIEDSIHFAEELADDFRSWVDALTPTLETVEDIYMAMRKMKAFSSNDTAAQAQVMLDQAKIDQRRTERVIEKKLRADDPQMFQDAVADRLKRAEMYKAAAHDYSPINMPAIEKAARADVEAQKDQMRRAAGVTVNVQPGAVVVHGDTSDESTHKEAGDGVAKHVINALERAAKKGGG